MYLSLFHLDELPFSLTPDHKFFFMSRKQNSLEQEMSTLEEMLADATAPGDD